MSLYRASLQTLGAIVLLVLVLACNGKSKGSTTSPTTATISGTVTYLRVPLVNDAQGKPTGLADSSIAGNLVSLPAQGVYIHIYQQIQQTAADGTTTTPANSPWMLASTTYTTATGTYSAEVTKGRVTMVELSSVFTGGIGTIRLIAEPTGISSTTGIRDRVQYAMRKAVDGTALPGDKTPSSLLSANAVVDFSVGLNDAWWIIDPDTSAVTSLAPHVTEAVIETSLPGRTSGTGSRVLGIGDTIASFVTTYGFATPSGDLDLHYWPGLDSGGSYIVYDRSSNPLTHASSIYFGTLRGGPANDDAWDQGVILPLLARNVLYAGNLSRTFGLPLNPIYPPATPLPDLSPDMARIEGLAQAMAANVLKSPYLADTQGTGLASPVVDVRDISSLSSAQLSPLSAPAIRAFAWEVILKANSLPATSSPSAAPSGWASINPLGAARFFLAPASTGIGANGVARDSEPLNIFNQINRLKESKATTEPFDLATIFTEAVLTSLGGPFGITWPRPATGAYASFVADWGTDPTGVLLPVPLSMAKAIQVNGAYPNVSDGEVFYSGFNLSVDRRFTLSAAISGLVAGGQVEVDLPLMPRTFSFTGSGGTTEPIVIPAYNAAPSFHPVRIHLKSPTVLQPDVVVTLTLTPAP